MSTRLRVAGIVAVVLGLAAAGWVWVVPVAMERLVRDVLLRNPEILIEAVRVLRLRDEADVAARRLAALEEFGGDLRDNPALPVFGNPDGDVTVVEFLDYRCQYCRQFHPQIAAMLAADPAVRLVYRNFPLLGPESNIAARASVAAARQNPALFPAFHDALMEARGGLDEATILRLASDSGLDADLLVIDMADPEIDGILEINFRFAAALGLDGTPAFVIGDAVVPGYIDAAQVLRLVRAAREECRTC